jgi:surface polysaccharide O-acyltransferase-like enzyme
MVTRESRFDILRLLSMFMIIVGHLIYHGIRHITSDEMADPGFEHTAIGLTNFCLLQLTGYLCNIGPNLFIMISGYFLIHPRPIRYSLEKSVRLWCTIVFYSLLFYGIFIATGLYAYDTETLLRLIMPIHSTSYWFMTMYIGVLLLSPFLARLAQSLSKREYQAMLAVLLIMNFGQENWGYGIVYSSTLFFYVFVFLIGQA